MAHTVIVGERRQALAVLGHRLADGDIVLAGGAGVFYSDPPKELWQEFEGLSVYTVSADYMLALKVYAARIGDYQDVQMLIQHLNIHTTSEVLDIVERYIPQNLLTVKHRYFADFAEPCTEGIASP